VDVATATGLSPFAFALAVTGVGGYRWGIERKRALLQGTATD